MNNITTSGRSQMVDKPNHFFNGSSLYINSKFFTYVSITKNCCFEQILLENAMSLKHYL